jgi:hypothetical protein
MATPDLTRNGSLRIPQNKCALCEIYFTEFVVHRVRSSYICIEYMKRFFIPATMLAFLTAVGLTLVGFDFAGVVNTFTAQPDGDGITLNWQSEIESGISHYTVQRASITSTNDFQSIATITPTGNYSYYKYHDNHLSMAPLGGQGGNMKTLSDAYKYRLEIDLASGDVSYSTTVSVTKPSSGVRRTWGMIKEMFH